MKSYITATLYGIVMMFVANQAQAVVMPLETRLGGLAYYDPNLDITWAANANINGSAFWDVQVAWAESLTIGGVSGWRLASADVNGDGTVVDCSGGGVIGCSDNEMGYLFWEEGITASNPGPFSNVRTIPGVFYWSGTESATDATRAWRFNFADGTQSTGLKNIDRYAWAVHSGDVSVPVPPAIWLFGSGLLGLVGIARRKKAI
jgi:hypothetical protein